MFIGHYGVGFAAKSLAPQVSLGTLFLAAQFVDLLWPTLALLGLERVRVEPGATAVTPLVFEHYPISHSLLAVIGWAALVGCVFLLRRGDRRGALVLGALVISHWCLDAIVHRPDLPLVPGGGVRVGLSAWSSLAATVAIELPLFAAGLWLYLRTTRPADHAGRWGLWALAGFLAAVYASSLAGPPPPGAEAVAWVGQSQWLLVLWAYWVDRYRPARHDA